MQQHILTNSYHWCSTSVGLTTYLVQVSLSHSGAEPSLASVEEETGSSGQVGVIKQGPVVSSSFIRRSWQATPRQQQEGVDLSMIIQWTWPDPWPPDNYATKLIIAELFLLERSG